jgi:protein TonB
MKRAVRPLVWGLSLCAVVGLHGAAWQWLSAVAPVLPLADPAPPQAMAVDMVPAPVPVPPPPVLPQPVPKPAPAPPVPPAPPQPVPKPAPAPIVPPAPEPIPAPVAAVVDESLPLPPTLPPKPPSRPRHATPRPRPQPPLPQAPAVAVPAPARAKPSPPSAPVSQAAESTWESRLLGRLLAFRRYPQDAVARGEQGTVSLRVTMTSDGTVTDTTLVKSSGYAELDAEAAAWVRRASPLPPPPGGAPVTLVVPLQFHLDDGDDPS